MNNKTILVWKQLLIWANENSSASMIFVQIVWHSAGFSTVSSTKGGSSTAHGQCINFLTVSGILRSTGQD